MTHNIFVSYFLLLMTCFALMLTGCSEKDYYDPDFMQQQARDAFPVRFDEIDASHTWETVSLVTADVVFGADAPDTLWLYAGDPFSSADAGALLAKHAVTSGHNTFTFDRPLTSKYIYLLIRDASGRAIAIADSLDAEGRLEHDFTAGGASAVRRHLLTRAATRAVSDYGWTPAEVSASDVSLFPTAAPKGAVALPASYDYYNFVLQGDHYLVTSATQSINCNAGATFYVQGNVSLSTIYFAGEGRIVVLPGSTLTVNGLSLSFNTSLAVCPGGTLDCGKGTLNLSNSCRTIYNAGTIRCGAFISSSVREFYNQGSLVVNGRASNLTNLRLYNGTSGSFSCVELDMNNETKVINAGSLEVTGACKVQNNSTLLVNGGTLQAGSFQIAGSGRFYNEDTGQMTVSGQTLISSSNSVWDNSGRFTTQTMTFNSGSEQWVNRCQMYVTDKLSLDLGGGCLYIDGGGYVECGSYFMNNAKVVMGSKAYFNCLGTATFNYSAYNPWWPQGHQGFIGVGDDYALIRIKRAVKKSAGTYPAVNFIDRLQVTTEGFEFPQQKDAWNVNYHMDGGAAAVSYNGGTVDIEASLCSPIFTPQPEETIPSSPQIYTYAFEDMTYVAGDYDFNDVVFTVTNPIDGKITLTLLAAGATKTNSLCLKTDKGNNNNIKTIFADATTAFEGSDGYLINTEPDEERLAPVTVTVEVPEGFSIYEDGDFFIVDASGMVHLPKFTQGFKAGDVPYAIRVPGAWKWPAEYVLVSKAYPGFINWAKDATQDPDWYDTYVKDKVIE